MKVPEELRAELSAAVNDAPSAVAAADRLCDACVNLLDVDGASISLIHRGAVQGTLGADSEASRRLDSLQFTMGEGPCLDAVRHRAPVLVADIDSESGRAWPGFTEALADSGVGAIFALPVSLASYPVGALDLTRRRKGELGSRALSGGLLAAKLAVLPLLDLIAEGIDAGRPDRTGDSWEQLASLERVEVYQATGMIVGSLEVTPAEALVRLRAYAFTRGMTASEAAWEIVERRVPLDHLGSRADRSGS